MTQAHGSITVNVPIRTAYDQWTQFEQFPQYMKGIESVTQINDALVHFKTKVKGVKREYDAEITVQRPDECIAWASTSGPRMEGRVTFESAGPAETIVSVDLTWEPETGLEKIGAAIGLDDHQVKVDLERFKDFIEVRGRETGAWRGSIHNGGTAPSDPSVSANGLDVPEPAAFAGQSGPEHGVPGQIGPGPVPLQPAPALEPVTGTDPDLAAGDPAHEDPDAH